MLRFLFAACIVTLFTTPVIHAQRFGSSGSSAFGGMGSSGFGSSSFGSGFGSSGFGGGFGNSGFGGGSGMSGFGNSGFGGGMSGFGGMSSGMGGFGNSGMGGMGSSGMGGFGNQGMGGNSGGQAFVGRDGADMASTWNQMGQAGAQFFNQMNRSMNRNNRDRSNEQVENPPQQMRVSLQVAFNATRPSPDELTNTLRTRLGRVLAEQNIAAPQVTMEGDVAVLGGVAATESQRLVLEKLVALEPGVSAVRNEMVVAAPNATE